jgi:hypothetical protein
VYIVGERFPAGFLDTKCQTVYFLLMPGNVTHSSVIPTIALLYMPRKRKIKQAFNINM